MINQKLQEFEEEVKATGDIITQATIDIYSSIVQTMLPTPTKIHYLFNLRDISKVLNYLLLIYLWFRFTPFILTYLIVYMLLPRLWPCTCYLHADWWPVCIEVKTLPQKRHGHLSIPWFQPPFHVRNTTSIFRTNPSLKTGFTWPLNGQPLQ